MYQNLKAMFDRADPMDIDDGTKAYSRYHVLMQEISKHYSKPLSAVVAGFVALSPNSDYLGNLRSLITLLEADQIGLPMENATVSTYNACRARAILYLTGTMFLDHAKGLKTRAFYQNILEPDTAGPVTIDGHMYWAWIGSDGGMRDANITRKVYSQISTDIRKLSDEVGMLPHCVQAILWFTRKREQNVIYNAQLNLFAEDAGYQKTAYKVSELVPYNIKR